MQFLKCPQCNPVNMKSKKGILLLLLSTLLFVSCGKREIKGDVFIVTNGAVNYKMGLVKITAIPEEVMQSYLSSSNYIGIYENFSHLPRGISTATTDADGKFTLKLPKPGKYALTASAERRILDETEVYRWLIWVRDSDKTITLSNDNLIESGSLDSVIPILRY